ncbi:MULTISPECIES: ESPR-type extended signal peptide-containing protein [unclassified Stenotrophomonas]|uniref:ESPR-type extended signal peptide-containing protein n=1 Tax=unclassified Stenotrophomonas TaxID=196198 RepID=UPI002118DCC9|nr:MULTISPECIES: ESPR-type extended signal peptide-containing protein [unclassified Stenotrophomonas]
MNKIYRRVWSTALQCWVVASELASVRGKRAQVSGRSAALIALLGLAPMTAAAVEVADDDAEWWERQVLSAFHAISVAPSGNAVVMGVIKGSVYGNTSAANWSLVTAEETMALGGEAGANGHGSFTAGIKSRANGAGGVTVGNFAEGYGQNSTVVGYFASATNGGYGTAVGARAIANGLGTTALGNGSKAYSENSVAVGSGSKTHDGAGISKIAIGGDAYAGSSGWTGAIAVGGDSRAEFDGLALGYEALAVARGAVALGRGSSATEVDTVSVGNYLTKRRIVNVADGVLDASSTDAVTGRQLNATNERLTAATTTANAARTTANTAKSTADRALAAASLVTQTSTSSTIRVGGSNTGTVLDVANRSGTKRRIQNIDNGVLSATSTDAVTGQQLHATNQSVSTATSTATAAKTAADGAAAKATVAANTTATGTAMTAANKATATGTGALASGTSAKAQGTHATALGFSAQATANQATAVGREAVATGTYATALGNLAKAGGGSALALGDRSSATHGNAVALGAGSVTASDNSVSVGNASGKRKIQYVADGTIGAGSTDAVTGSQLHATNTLVGAAQSTATSAQTAAGAAQRTADALTTRATALEGLVSQTAVAGTVRLGAQNTGTTLDVRNKSDANRKISGVADATLSATSTEAVTGKQLAATNTSVTAAHSAAATAQTTATAAQRTADGVVTRTTALEGMVSQVSATGDLRLGGQNAGTVLDVRNRSNAARKLSGVADGTLSAASTEAVTGKQLNATNTNVTAAQNTATTAQAAATAAQRTADGVVTRATALEGLVSQVSASGNLRLGAQNTGTTLDLRNKSNAARKLSGVADGTLSATSTDAVTGKQLFGTQQKVTAHEGVLATHSSQLSGQDGRITDNRRDLDELRTEFENFDPDLDGVVKFAADGSIDLNGGKVRGVAAGNISSAGSTEAVNGGQLFATNERIDSIEVRSRFFKIGTDELSEDATAGWFGVALGESSEASPANEGGTAVGSFSKAMGTNSVALGRAAHVTESSTEGFALGASSRVEVDGGVALGAQAQVKASATNGVALGYGSYADQENTVSVGSGTVQRRVVNVGRGSGTYDATTVAQLQDSLATLGGGAGMVNGDVVAPTYNVQGGMQNTVGDALSSLDLAVFKTGARVGSVEHQLRSVFQDGPSIRSDGLSQINLAGASGMVLGNVANGLIAPGSRDAVNGSQLHATEQKIERNRNEIDGLRDLLEPADGARLTGMGGLIDFGGVRLTGIDDALLSADSSDAVTGRQLHASNRQIGENKQDVDKLRADVDGLDPDLGNVVKFTAGRSVVELEGARIVGLAAGDISSIGSTDAVNGGQLFATNQRVSSIEQSGRFVAVTFDDESNAAQAGEFSVAIGNGAEAGQGTDGATAIGAYARARARSSVALGRASFVDGAAENSFALGTGSTVLSKNGIAFGSYARVQTGAEGSVALGADSAATEDNVISVGNSTLKRRIVNLARGGDGNDAATVGQLRGALATLGGEVDADGNVVGPIFAIQGGSQQTLNDALTALDTAVISNSTRVGNVEHQLRSVFQDSPATRTDGLNQLNLAGPDGMVLGNVANGLIAPGSRDAVNGGQLHAMEQRLDGRIDGLEQRVDTPPQGRAMATASAPTPLVAEEEGSGAVSGTPEVASAAEGNGRIASADDVGKPAKADAPAHAPTPTPQVSTADLEKMLARANEYTDDAIKGVEQRLDKMDKRFNRLAAMNSAQSAMAMNTAGLATYNRLGAGVGYSDGESAMAVGYQRVLNEKGSATFSLNGAFTNSGEQSVGLGVGIGW